MYISERDCCEQNTIDSYCTFGDFNIEDCCLEASNIKVPYCSDDPGAPDDPSFDEEYCCESFGGQWDEENGCDENINEWIETYFDFENNICANGVNECNDISIYT